MLKVNANIVGIGSLGVDAINYIKKSGFLGGKRISISSKERGITSLAEYVYSSRSEFVNNYKTFFPTDKTITFIIVDTSNTFDVSLACEVGALSQRVGALSVALCYAVSTKDVRYDISIESLEEIHSVCNSVVRFNEGYNSNFLKSILDFMETISASMSAQAQIRVDGFDGLKQVFKSRGDMYFATYIGMEHYDSHLYYASCLCNKLCRQMYLDTAQNITYFYTCAAEADKTIIREFTEPIEKTNIGVLNERKIYISSNNMELKEGQFMFSVLCGE